MHVEVGPQDQIQAFRAFQISRDYDPRRVVALAAERTGECTLDLTLGEGKYHQGKRMLAAVGNRVEGLHRSRFGPLLLPADLPSGDWRWLTAVEREALSAAVGAPVARG